MIHYQWMSIYLMISGISWQCNNFLILSCPKLLLIYSVTDRLPCNKLSQICFYSPNGINKS